MYFRDETKPLTPDEWRHEMKLRVGVLCWEFFTVLLARAHGRRRWVARWQPVLDNKRRSQIGSLLVQPTTVPFDRLEAFETALAEVGEKIELLRAAVEVEFSKHVPLKRPLGHRDERKFWRWISEAVDHQHDAERAHHEAGSA